MKYFMITIAMIALLLDCAPQVDSEAEKAAVKQVVDQMAQAMEAEDMEMISNIVANDSDMVNFGTDAAERWVGWEALKTSIEKQFEAFEDSKVSASNQVIKVHSSGKVAWFSETMNWSLMAQGQMMSLEGIRFTGVLEKRNGKWVLVQMHFSAPVSGQAVAY